MKIGSIRHATAVPGSEARPLESFATNSADRLDHHGLLVRPWLDRYPFQPPWAPWHPALSGDYPGNQPRRFRQSFLMTDLGLVRLYLEQAIADDKFKRVAMRIQGEKRYEVKFFDHQASEALSRTMDFRTQKRLEIWDRIRRFRRLWAHQAEELHRTNLKNHASAPDLSAQSMEDKLSIIARSHKLSHEQAVRGLQQILAGQWATVEGLLTKHIGQGLTTHSSDLPSSGGPLKVARKD